MEEVVGEILGAIIILILVAPLVGPVLFKQETTYPGLAPASFSGTIIISCNTTTYTYNGMVITTPTEYHVTLNLFAVAHGPGTITIDKIKPVGANEEEEVSMRMAQGEAEYENVSLPLISLKNKERVKPGSVLYYKPGEGLTVLENGLIKERTLLPQQVTTPPVCPHSPAIYMTPDITGNIIGLLHPHSYNCGGVNLGELPDGGEEFILVQFTPLETQEASDIPLFLIIYNNTQSKESGFWYETPGKVYTFGSPSNAIINEDIHSDKYFALLINSSGTKIYNKTSDLILSSPSNIISGTLYLGLQRYIAEEKPFATIFVFYIPEWQTNTGGGGSPSPTTPASLIPPPSPDDSQWLGNTTYYIYVYYSGVPSPIPKEWGPGYETGDFLDPTTWSNILYAQTDYYWNPPPWVWLRDLNPTGPSPYDNNGVYHGKELLDYVIDWNDAGDENADMKVRLTLFSDGYLRIETLYPNSSPPNYIFIANPNNYAPTTDNNNDYLPDNWKLIKILTTQPSNTVWWIDVSDMVDIGQPDNLTSKIKFIGVYTNSTITVRGIQPGDRVIFSTGDKGVAINATEAQVKINLLDYFNVTDIINAIKTRGGIDVIIQQTYTHIVEQIPTKIQVHAKGESYDYWDTIEAQVVSECKAGVETKRPLNTTIPIQLWTPDWAFWYIKIGGIDLGEYLSGTLSLFNGTLTLYDTEGNKITINEPVRIIFGDPKGIIIYYYSTMEYRLVPKIYAIEGKVSDIRLSLLLGK